MTSRQQHNGTQQWYSVTSENFSKKNFKKIYTIFFPYPKYAYIPRGDSPSILFTFENFVPKKSPFLRFFRFCTFLWSFSESSACSSGYVQKFIPFRIIIYAIYRYYNLKLWLLTIYLIDSQIVSTYISKMLLK